MLVARKPQLRIRGAAALGRSLCMRELRKTWARCRLEGWHWWCQLFQHSWRKLWGMSKERPSCHMWCFGSKSPFSNISSVLALACFSDISSCVAKSSEKYLDCTKCSCWLLWKSFLVMVLLYNCFYVFPVLQHLARRLNSLKCMMIVNCKCICIW